MGPFFYNQTMRATSCILSILIPTFLLLAACTSAATAPGLTETPVPIETPAFSPTFIPTPAPPNLVLLAELTGSSGPIYNLDWSPDGKTLLSAGYAQVNLWDVDTRTLISTLSGHTNIVWNVAWSPDGKTVASDSVDKSVRLWDFATRQSKFVLIDASMDTLEFLYSLAWSPDGTLLASGSSRGTITAWDAQTGQPVWYANRSQDITDRVEIISMDWSPNGTVLAAGYLNGEIILWEAETGIRINTILDYTTHRSDVNGLAWAPDGSTFATAHQDGHVRLWDAVSYELLMDLTASSGGWLRGIAWSPDGSKLAVVGEYAQVHVWDPVSGELLGYYKTGATPLWSIAWSPDGSTLAAGSGRYEKITPGGTIYLFAAP
jgi:WD40 repeat protein